ncbi:hypothetical protein PSSHI_05120 [Photobacterium sp. R1]
MSSDMNSVIKLKSIEQKIEVMKGWKKISKIEKRQDTLKRMMHEIDSEYNDLNHHFDVCTNAELNNLAIHHASYLSAMRKNLQDEFSHLSEKHQHVTKEVTLANARVEIFEDLDKETRTQQVARKNRAQLESELMEATGRKKHDADSQ